MKKVFVAGGGTGGHFYPALSVSHALHEKGFSVFYIGTKNGIEGQKEFPFGEKILFDTKGVRGRNITGKFISIVKLLQTTLKVKKILKKEKPDFAICFGGYASLPLGLAAFLEGIPLYIHEQNSIPSYTNKVLSLLAKKIFITFDYSKRFFPEEKTFLTGLPVRKRLKEDLNLSKEEARDLLKLPKNKKIVLIFGGSQGAKKLTEIGEKVAEKEKDIFFIIITGKNSRLNKKLSNIKSFEYFEDMGLFYKASDLVISRAGAGTVSEILLFGKPSIFVPYLYAASNHQFFNAKWLEDKGLAYVIEEKFLNEKILRKKIKEALLKDLSKLETEIKKYAMKDAEERILKEIGI